MHTEFIVNRRSFRKVNTIWCHYMIFTAGSISPPIFTNYRTKFFAHNDFISSVVWSSYYDPKLTDDTKSSLAAESHFTRRLKLLNAKNVRNKLDDQMRA